MLYEERHWTEGRNILPRLAVQKKKNHNYCNIQNYPMIPTILSSTAHFKFPSTLAKTYASPDGLLNEATKTFSDGEELATGRNDYLIQCFHQNFSRK